MFYVWEMESGKPVVYTYSSTKPHGVSVTDEEGIVLLYTWYQILCKKLRHAWCSSACEPCALTLLRGAYWHALFAVVSTFVFR